MILALRRWPPMSLLALPARVYLAVVFLLACWHKLLDPASFALDIATYQILPTVLVNPMALLLPWVELLAGLMLLLAFRTRAAALLIAGMMFMFTVAITIAVIRGLEMSCGCFASQGLVEDPISWFTVLRDLSWLALALFVLFLDRRPLGLDTWLAARKGESTP